MQFKLTKEFLNNIRVLISGGNVDLQECLEELHVADIADIMEAVTLKEAQILYYSVGEERASDILIELDEDTRERFLASLTSREIAERVIGPMESDDSADVIRDLPDDKQKEVISLIKDVDQARDISALLNYEEGTAGALMAKELINVKEHWTIVECVREMRRQAKRIDHIYTVYVTDHSNHLVGTLSVKELLMYSARTEIKEIYNDKVISVRTGLDDEEVASIMEKYDLAALPVVDEFGKLLGRITIDDVVDVMKEEAEKDYQLASGISVDIESTDSVWSHTRARFPWLLIGLVGGVFGAMVIGIYEEEIRIYPEMALFIPLIAAMGGNVGVQSSAIIVQGLANKSLALGGIIPKLKKEFFVALLNGIMCSLIILAYTLLTSASLEISITVSTALFTVIICAALLGTFVPLVLNKYNIDPALATGPFITTMNDIFGLLLYFAVGRVMYTLL